MNEEEQIIAEESQVQDILLFGHSILFNVIFFKYRLFQTSKMLQVPLHVSNPIYVLK